MNAQKILSIILVILMAIPLVPITPTQAQTPSIQTSADPHGGLFYNNTWVEIKVTDVDRSGTGQVSVNVYKNGIPEGSLDLLEIGNSGIFVAYFVYNDTAVADPANPLVNQFYYYNGTGGVLNSSGNVVFELALADGDELTFEYIGPGGTVTATITYEPFEAQVLLDRDMVPAFGNATIYITIHDQDYNKDPTAIDSITNYNLNFTLVDKLGNVYNWSLTLYQIDLTETGPNTAHFVGSLQLDDIFVNLNYVGNDAYYLNHTDYMGNNWTAVNFDQIANGTVPFDHIAVYSEDGTSAKIYLFTSTGIISVPATVSLATELVIEVTDADSNLNTSAKDVIYVEVTLTDFTGTDNDEIVMLVETDVDTGVFTGKVYLNYDDTERLDTTNDIFYVNATRDIQVAYWDPTINDTAAAIDRTMTDYDPEITVEPTQVLPTGTVTITLTDMDLNDKGDDAVDSFGQSVATGDVLNGTNLSFANNKQGYLEILRDGTPLTAGQNFFLFFEEVEPGVFQATFSLTWIQEDLADGDVVEFKWVDKYSGDVSASATVTISRPEITVSLDRDTYPMPANGQFTGYITINNAFANVNPGLKDSIDVTDVTVEIILWNGTSVTAPITGPSAITETDVDTGTFVGEFTVDISTNTIVYTGATLKVTYNFSGNLYEDTAVIRPSTASMTVNATNLAMGDYLYITLVEPDENTDSLEAEKVTISVSGDVTGTTIELTETGVNTGIFEGVVRIGVDAPFDFDTPYRSFTLSFKDEYTAETSVTYKRDRIISIEGTVRAHDAEFYIGKPDADVEAVGPYSAVTIYVKDPDFILIWEDGKDLNLTALEAEIYLRSLLGTEHTVDILEPADEWATFKATVQLDYADDPQYPGTAQLNVTVPDNIVFRFVDPVASDGSSKASVKWLKVMAWDGQLEVIPEKPFYNDKDDIVIRVVDPDRNKDPNTQDEVTVRITSWRMVGDELQPVDPAGTTLTLIETEADSGVFEVPYTIDTESFPPFFSIGDILKIEYEDPIAADGETKVTSEVMLQIGFTTATPITPGAPDNVNIADLEGAPTTPKAGTPIILQVPVSNIDTTRSVTVDVILVAYMDGVPMSVALAQVTIGAGESTIVNVPWLPDTPGDYEVRIFFWNLAEKTPLSEEPLVLNITVE